MAEPILTVDSLRRVEAAHADAAPPLMERAGRAAAALAREMLAGGKRVLVVAGPGNNGGDARVLARLLETDGHAVTLLSGENDWPAGEFDLVVDGLFGIGLARPIGGRHAEWIARMNACGAPILALDVPSGLAADTGQVAGPCVRATRTATFIALKPGLLTADGPDVCGAVSLFDLGLALAEPDGQVVAPDLFLSCLRPRARNSHKGRFGSVAVIGGAPGMAGAALLAGRAALKLGAGRVFVGLLERLALDIAQPELMLREPGEALALASVLAVGPGLGQSVQAGELLARAIDSPLPLVLDADALNLLAQGPVLLRRLAGRTAVSPAPTFATPHPAEAARLLGSDVAAVQADRLVAALALAKRLNAFVALKGCGTLVTAPDGRWFINANGNPGLASAGSGDVLTGMLAALLAQGWPPLEALLAAVHLHGAAADACVARGQGPIGLAAGELVEPARALLNGWITPSPKPHRPPIDR